MTDLRPAMCVRTGAMTTLERWDRWLRDRGEDGVVGVRVPEEIAGVTREIVDVPVNEHADNADVTFVDARRVLPDDEEALLDWPWDVIRHRDRAIAMDIELLTKGIAQRGDADRDVCLLNDGDVYLTPRARVMAGAVIDAEKGPVIIGDGTVVRPRAVIVGPAVIGRDCVISEHALIKANTAIGPVCKVGGEVGGTIFQGFANKVHEGHLGDSWVGTWANLGAATTNSNLLNTYGEVVCRATPEGGRVRTGLAYLGAIIGDHAKFAIGTRIMTGTVVGTGAMVASSTPPAQAVERFTWLTDKGAQRFRFEKFLDVARTMMARRDREVTDAYEARLSVLHEGVA